MHYKQLTILTRGYPFGNSEVSFLSSEIPILATRFDKIIIFPIDPDRSKPTQSLPENVQFITLKEINSSKFERTVSDYFFVIGIFVSEFLQSGNFKLFKNTKYHLSEIFVYLLFAKKIKFYEENGLIEGSSNLYYSYWFDAGASIMSIFKKRYRKDVRFISRAHGFDLYEERSEKGYIFPRILQIKYVDRVFTISEQGKKYLISLYPAIVNKIETSYLGTVGYFKENNNEPNSTNTINLVSCSSIIPLKRVHKIIEILDHCKSNIKWVHFGDGDLKAIIEKMSLKLPPNIQTEFKGNCLNSEILSFYAKHKINWFINVSETEGIPVSIMEAISFGIPVIATNVGGVSEIVNNITGMLIDKNFEPKKIAEIIDTRVFDDVQRDDIKDFWKHNFSSITNTNNFANRISQI